MNFWMTSTKHDLIAISSAVEMSTLFYTWKKQFDNMFLQYDYDFIYFIYYFLHYVETLINQGQGQTKKFLCLIYMYMHAIIIFLYLNLRKNNRKLHLMLKKKKWKICVWNWTALYTGQNEGLHNKLLSSKLLYMSFTPIFFIHVCTF